MVPAVEDDLDGFKIGYFVFNFTILHFVLKKSFYWLVTTKGSPPLACGVASDAAMCEVILLKHFLI